MDSKSRIVLYAFFFVLFLSVVATYNRTLIQKDYERFASEDELEIEFEEEL